MCRFTCISQVGCSELNVWSTYLKLPQILVCLNSEEEIYYKLPDCSNILHNDKPGPFFLHGLLQITRLIPSHISQRFFCFTNFSETLNQLHFLSCYRTYTCQVCMRRLPASLFYLIQLITSGLYEGSLGTSISSLVFSPGSH